MSWPLLAKDRMGPLRGHPPRGLGGPPAPPWATAAAMGPGGGWIGVDTHKY